MRSAADHGAVLVEDDEVWMRELQPAVEPCHLAREDASGTPAELALPVADQSRLPEEGAGHGSPMIGDGGLESRLARQPIVRAVRKVEGTGIHDLRHDRDFLTFLEEREVAQLGTGEIAAGHMPQSDRRR